MHLANMERKRQSLLKKVQRQNNWLKDVTERVNTALQEIRRDLINTGMTEKEADDAIAIARSEGS